MFSLSEHEIAKRERELWARQIEERKAYALPGPTPALPEAASAEPVFIMGNDEESTYAMGVDLAAEGEDQTAYQEVATDDSPRDKAIAAQTILLTDYPGAQGPLSFELQERWGVGSIAEVPDEHMEEVVSVLRSIYMEERSQRGAQ